MDKIKKIEKRQNIIILLFTALAAFGIVRLLGMSTLNFMGLILAAGIYVVGRVYISRIANSSVYAGDSGRKIKITSVILSSLYTLFTLMADSRRIIGDLNSKLFVTVVIIGSAIGLWIIFYVAVSSFYVWVMEREGTNNVKENPGSVNTAVKDTCISDKKILVIFFIALIFTRLPALLINAPGIMTVDSLNQYGQLTGYLPPSNHHPYAHTLLIGLCLNIGRAVFGSEAGGILVYSILQLVICALIHTYGADTMLKLGASRLFLILYWCFYGLVPYNVLYAITMWKDVLFSAMAALYTTVLIRLLSHRVENNAKTYVIYMLSAFGICLLRSNGLMAFIVTLPFVIIAGKGFRRFAAVSGVAVITCAMIITGPVYSSLNLQMGDTVEALSIPVQMAARVYADGRPVSEEHDLAWRQILDTDRIPEEYEDFCSDHMKNLVREGDQDYLAGHLKETAALWISFGLAHPVSYINGFIDATKGFYYPDVEAPNIIGADHSVAPNDYGLSSTAPFHNSITIKIEELGIKLPSLLPFYGYLYSPGMFFWIFLLLAGLCIIKNGFASVVVFLPNLAIFATLMAATPVNNEFRYIYSLVLCIPLYFGWSGLLGLRSAKERSGGLL